ncbi:MAG: efflux RND transporter permease subunit [Bacteroidales bacterium]
MNLKLFIERPVLSTVISIIIVLLGLLGYFSLPVTLYPNIAPPSVEVNANYPGANAQTVVESVIIPIEEKINGVEGMTYITSTASNDGNASITVYFEQGYDPDIAAVNVQNRVSTAASSLPDVVNRSGIRTQKLQNSPIMYAGLISKNPAFDETFIRNYINIYVQPEIQRIKGVGKFSGFGSKDYSMNIWVSPIKMANYNVNIDEVSAAIREQSMEVSAGSFGQNSGQAFEYTIKYKGRYKEVEEYENIIINALEDGSFLYLKDIADIHLGAQSYTGKGSYGEYPSSSFGIFQTPNSNAQKISEEIHATFKRLSEDLPEGLEFIINFDTNSFLEASFLKVKKTIFEAFILVFIVVFIFLQSYRSTIIPAIAVPVAIIGTFFFLDIFGYSLNLLTLFALILAVGIVIDDAIVVVEAIFTKIEEGEKNPRKASISAMQEISGAIVSITLVMAAVFVPVTFIEGPSGVFYKQFGVTLIVAIIISAINALTLSPALCALFLRPPKKNKKVSFFKRIGNGFNIGFNRLTQKYMHSLVFLFKHKWISLLIIIIAVVFFIYSNQKLSRGFVPSEDQGVIFVNIELPAASSLERTIEVNKQLYKIVQEVPEVASYVNFNGFNFFSGAGSQYGIGFMRLKPWKDRKRKDQSSTAIIGKLFALSQQIPDAQIIFLQPPPVRGFGSSNGVEAKLLDLNSEDLMSLDTVTKNFVEKLNERPEIQFVSNSFNSNFPQFELLLNVEKAKQAGVSINELLGNIQGFIGGNYTTNFNKFGKQYRVYIQSKPEDRKNPNDLSKMYVTTNKGKAAPISEFIQLKKVYGPQSIYRYNLYNSVTLNGSAAGGYSTGDAIKAFEEVAQQHLPNTYELTFSGISREELIARGKTLTIFVLSLLFVYFLLAAQYESYLLPFAVIISLIIGVSGAYLSIMVFGIDNNIFFQIALIMLLGLLAKNAILIVEISRQQRKKGKSLIDAALKGSKSRLRPILMTSFAFIIGLLPLVLARGVNSVGNHSIGTGAAGGMLIGTLIGIFVIPSLFVVFQFLHELISKKLNA